MRSLLDCSLGMHCSALLRERIWAKWEQNCHHLNADSFAKLVIIRQSVKYLHLLIADYHSFEINNYNYSLNS